MLEALADHCKDTSPLLVLDSNTAAIEQQELQRLTQVVAFHDELVEAAVQQSQQIDVVLQAASKLGKAA